MNSSTGGADSVRGDANLLDAARFVHTSFDKAFADGLSFTYEEDRVTMRQRQVGTLVLTTGRIVACDPGWVEIDDSKPLVRSVPPGSYPVILSIADFGEGLMNACARVQFAPGGPARWELALEEGQDPRELKGDECFGYGVDTGIGCFVDVAGLDILSKDETYDRLLKAMEQQSEHYDWGQLVIDEERKLNVVAFGAGYGDGAYSTYWGLDEQDRPVCLLTDFALFLTNIETTFTVDDLEIGKNIEHPELAEAHLTVWLDVDPENGLALAAQGPQKGSVAGRIVDARGTVLADTRDAGSGYYHTEGEDICASYFGCYVEGEDTKPSSMEEALEEDHSEDDEPRGSYFGRRLHLTGDMELEITFIKKVESL